MHYLVFVVLLLLLTVTSSFAKDNTLYFQARANKKTVYTTPTAIDPDANGIVALILADVVKRLNIEVVYQRLPSGRVEEALLSGALDGSMMSKKDMISPDEVLFTRPFMTYQIFLYSKSPFEKNKPLHALLVGKRICTHRSYTYPGVTDLLNVFAEKKSSRIDSGSDFTMWGMLQKNRCDIALIDEHTANWLMASAPSENKMFQSPLPLISIEITMAFNNQWKDLVERLNEHISNLISSGKMVEIYRQAELQKR